MCKVVDACVHCEVYQQQELAYEPGLKRNHFAREACDQGGCMGTHDSVPAGNLVVDSAGRILQDLHFAFAREQ